MSDAKVALPWDRCDSALINSCRRRGENRHRPLEKIVQKSCDVAVVGAGILGLAHAYHAARRGQRVVVCERHPRAQGASIRNFGMIWPIGQPLGDRFRLACRSRDLWHEVLAEAGLWHERSGSLHLAYHDDEAALLDEFVHREGAERSCRLMSADEIVRRSPGIRRDGLRIGVFSPGETNVDPREVVAQLPGWLTNRFGVEFRWGCPVVHCESGRLTTHQGDLAARHIFVCTGDDFQTLLPDRYAAAGLYRCKLQMMRTTPVAAGLIGPMLAAGLTLLHYPAFAACRSLGEVRRRFERTAAELLRFGIHVMVSRTGAGELTLGDSHEYRDEIDIFDKPHVDELILDYLRGYLDVPKLTIASRWHGTYGKHPTEPWLVDDPLPNVTAVTGIGGNGMTLSFGLAERVVAERLGTA
jgi:D-hydroxyproline dehydrogenase subunit beta